MNSNQDEVEHEEDFAYLCSLPCRELKRKIALAGLQIISTQENLARVTTSAGYRSLRQIHKDLQLEIMTFRDALAIKAGGFLPEGSKNCTKVESRTKVG